MRIRFGIVQKEIGVARRLLVTRREPKVHRYELNLLSPRKDPNQLLSALGWLDARRKGDHEKYGKSMDAILQFFAFKRLFKGFSKAV